MRDGSDSVRIDELLVSYLAASDDARALEKLDGLFENFLNPQITAALKKYPTLRREDIDEICSKARLRLVARLQKLRNSDTSSEKAGIENIRAYIKSVVKNLRTDHLLAKHPEWRHAANRIKHLAADPERDLEIFYDSEGLCCVRLSSFSALASSFDIDGTVKIVKDQHPRHLFLKIQELAPIVLKAVGHAVYRNDLVRAIVEITGSIRFEEVVLPSEIDDLSFNSEKYVESDRQQLKLRQVWAELIVLPPNQRKALLLSLKESHGTEAITLVLRKRIASIAEVVDALEISLEEFSSIFQRLPLSSREIAEILGIEGDENTSKEQKVDNLRSVARRLLRKRLGFRSNRNRSTKPDGQ